VLCDAGSGYSINVPAEWQDPNMAWWREPALQRRVMSARARAGIQLHDALWAATNGYPEPDPTESPYDFDEDTQTYTRTDVRV